ncbi:hypothetical protein [Mesorhizobium sp. WSM2561]|uniref:hypothetical protein n=1 Tax=Mesorhizobium sp. WSM2561 TaxID=1040985 RepID=UPI0004860A8D|nr:hypothetical protein [Mesorhizobium sp. WSM2561]
MQLVFEIFLELSESVDEADFRVAMAGAAAALDLLTFAYLSLPPRAFRQAKAHFKLSASLDRTLSKQP